MTKRRKKLWYIGIIVVLLGLGMIFVSCNKDKASSPVAPASTAEGKSDFSASQGDGDWGAAYKEGKECFLVGIKEKGEYQLEYALKTGEKFFVVFDTPESAKLQLGLKTGDILDYACVQSGKIKEVEETAGRELRGSWKVTVHSVTNAQGGQVPWWVPKNAAQMLFESDGSTPKCLIEESKVAKGVKELASVCGGGNGGTNPPATTTTTGAVTTTTGAVTTTTGAVTTTTGAVTTTTAAPTTTTSSTTSSTTTTTTTTTTLAPRIITASFSWPTAHDMAIHICDGTTSVKDNSVTGGTTVSVTNYTGVAPKTYEIQVSKVNGLSTDGGTSSSVSITAEGGTTASATQTATLCGNLGSTNYFPIGTVAFDPNSDPVITPACPTTNTGSTTACQ